MLLYGRQISNEKYTENIRRFALTLHFNSPRAYSYLREKFDDHLPHTGTIRQWYANSSVSGEAGLCRQSFEILSEKAAELKAKGKELMCTLILDEMSIRKHLQWSGSHTTFLGQINYGFRPECMEVPLANNALVFMVNGHNLDLNVAVAYYFVNSLTAEEKAALLREIISKVRECGVRVLSITFDGLSSNFTMCELLGANFNLNNLTPYFVLPPDDRNIYIIVDPSHVLKLARNTIGNKKTMCVDGHKIEWKYFESLENFRAEKDFAHAHKLTKRHIHYDLNKMNVRIAAETLSNSVANSMKLLMDKGFKQFANSAATIKYVKYINDCFDIFNTKGVKSDIIFKNAINPTNKTEIFAFFDELINYLKKITFVDGKTVLDSQYKTAFRGLIIDMTNFKAIYEECVDSNILDYYFQIQSRSLRIVLRSHSIT